MWGLIEDRSISEAKRLGHATVSRMHVAYCIARELERQGVTDLPVASRDIAAGLPAVIPELVQPTLPIRCRELVERVDGQDSAREVLRAILEQAGESLVPEPLGEALAELDGLIGLASVKASVRELVALQQASLVRAEEGLPPLKAGMNLVFTGAPGTGKTTVARLVARIYGALGLLSSGHLVEVGRADLVGQYVGHTEQRVLDAIVSAQGGALFIDEAYALAPMEDGRDFGQEAIATLVLEMENRREDLVVIVAGYKDPMRHFLESNEGLNSRFEMVVDFPDYSPEEMVQIWRNLADRAEVAAPPDVEAGVREHFARVYTGGSLGNGRYARRMLEEMCRRLALRAAADNRIHLSEVTTFVVEDVPAPEDVAGSGVSKHKRPAVDAHGAVRRLRSKVLGQDDAIRSIVDRLALTRATLDLSPERPDGVFLFAGPTGTGKTALAMALAEEFFESPSALIRLDMSEYAQKHSVSKLYGSPPGYKGSTKPSSWLTTKIRERPQSLLLLDEIEKAHPRVFDAFLQVFDAGRLTDSQGRLADFRDVVIVMTTNLGSDEFAERRDIGFGGSPAPPFHAQDAKVREVLKMRMRPELLNRLDATLVFRPLGRDTVRAIARNHLNEALVRLHERGWLIELHSSVEDWVVSEGYSVEYGARPMIRTVERLVLRPVVGYPPGRYRLTVIDADPRIEPC